MADPVLQNLTDLILENIFVRLPGDILTRMKFECKAFFDIIGSPQFRRQYLALDKKQLLLVDGDIFSVNLDDKEKTLHESPFGGESKRFEIVGSWKGIVCLFTSEMGFRLWNPNTRETRSLPPVGFNQINFYAFCEGPGNQPFLMVVGGTGTKVFNFDTSNWREIQGEGEVPGDLTVATFDAIRGIAVDLSVYWSDINRLVGFNMVEESFFLMPLSLELPIHRLDDVGGVLTVSTVHASIYDIWMMINGGFERILSLPIPGSRFTAIQPLHLAEGNLLVGRDGLQLDMYTLASGTASSSVWMELHFEDAIVYTRSLESPRFDD